jgi:HPt (histidine-containing phosphotransfer) domain-containing protein
MVHLARQTLGDPGLEHEVLVLFDETVRVYLSRIERARGEEELLAALHTLKGASAGIGAKAVAELAAAAENELRAGLPLDPERVDDLRLAVTELRTFIAELVGQEP